MIRDTPFDISGRANHADSSPVVLAADPLPRMNWRHGDELPQHLRPAPGEELLPVDAAPSPWPRIVPVDQQISDSAQSGNPAPEPRPWPASAEPASGQIDYKSVVEAAERGWSTPAQPTGGSVEPWPVFQPEPDPTNGRDPWQTMAMASDGEDGWRFRATSSDAENSARVEGVTAGFVCRLCGREARQFAHVDGDSRARDACSPECQHGIDIVVGEWGGEAMEQHNLTQMEKQAVKDTRLDIYKAIVAAGIASPEQMDQLAAAGQLSAEKFDALIMTIWNGVRASMQRQSSTGEIPF